MSKVYLNFNSLKQLDRQQCQKTFCETKLTDEELYNSSREYQDKLKEALSRIDSLAVKELMEIYEKKGLPLSELEFLTKELEILLKTEFEKNSKGMGKNLHESEKLKKKAL